MKRIFILLAITLVVVIGAVLLVFSLEQINRSSLQNRQETSIAELTEYTSEELDAEIHVEPEYIPEHISEHYEEYEEEESSAEIAFVPEITPYEAQYFHFYYETAIKRGYSEGVVQVMQAAANGNVSGARLMAYALPQEEAEQAMHLLENAIYDAANAVTLPAMGAAPPLLTPPFAESEEIVTP